MYIPQSSSRENLPYLLNDPRILQVRIEWRVAKGSWEGRRKQDKEKEITREEIKKVVDKLKDKKAVGVDMGYQLKYGSMEGKKLWSRCKYFAIVSEKEKVG